MRTHQRSEWDGTGVWSSHAVKSPQQCNRESFTEVLCVFSWSEDARKAFVKALRSYDRAGRPGIPLGAVDYQKQHRQLVRSTP